MLLCSIIHVSNYTIVYIIIYITIYIIFHNII